MEHSFLIYIFYWVITDKPRTNDKRTNSKPAWIFEGFYTKFVRLCDLPSSPRTTFLKTSGGVCGFCVGVFALFFSLCNFRCYPMSSTIFTTTNINVNKYIKITALFRCCCYFFRFFSLRLDFKFSWKKHPQPGLELQTNGAQKWFWF